MPEKDLKKGDDDSKPNADFIRKYASGVIILQDPTDFNNHKAKSYGISCSVKVYGHNMMDLITTIVMGDSYNDAMPVFINKWDCIVDDTMHAIVTKKYSVDSKIYTRNDMKDLRDRPEVEIEKGVFE